MRNQSQTADQAAQVAVAAPATPPTPAPRDPKAYNRRMHPEDDFAFDELLEEIQKQLDQRLDEFRRLQGEFLTEMQQKHAMFDFLYVCVEKNYPFYMVLDTLQNNFRNLDPEYILRNTQHLYTSRLFDLDLRIYRSGEYIES